MLIDSKVVLDITGMTQDGCGIAVMEGKKIFIDQVAIGEKVQARITKICDDYAAAEPVRILASDYVRQEPFCGHFEECGGCALQGFDYPSQLRIKSGILRESLERIAGVEPHKIRDVLGMEENAGYRNKSGYPVGMVDGEAIVGFYKARSNRVVDIELCGVQHTLSNQVKNVVRQYIRENNLSVYDKNTREGWVRHLVTRVSFQTGEVMMILVVNGEPLLDMEPLIASVTRSVPQVKSIYINSNSGTNSEIMGDKNTLLYGRPVLMDSIGKFSFEISPRSFFQVNPVQTQVLYDTVMEFAGLSGEETVLDLYCGIGTISLYLSERGGRVVGIEAVEEAVQDARRNAERNGVANVQFGAGRVEAVIGEISAQVPKVDVVVMDPPRKGCKASVLEAVAGVNPERIVYVSCNPSTLARDVKILAGHGFSVEAVQPVDMFPHTAHVETVVLMSRKDK